MKPELFHTNRFPKSEKLVSVTEIKGLFASKKKVTAFPLKIIYNIRTLHNEAAPLSVLVVVPKRKFKRAVDRNLLKRRIREAYRSVKSELNLHESMLKNIGILYISDEIAELGTIIAALRSALTKTLNKI